MGEAPFQPSASTAVRWRGVVIFCVLVVKKSRSFLLNAANLHELVCLLLELVSVLAQRQRSTNEAWCSDENRYGLRRVAMAREDNLDSKRKRKGGKLEVRGPLAD